MTGCAGIEKEMKGSDSGSGPRFQPRNSTIRTKCGNYFVATSLNFMGQNASSETNKRSAEQGIPAFYGTKRPRASTREYLWILAAST
jgi:hypothetical protein